MTYFKNIPEMADIDLSKRVVQKHLIPTRKALKGKKDRNAKKVEKSVRAQCEERDGSCRVGSTLAMMGDDRASLTQIGECRGESEWAHLGEKTRAKTRNQAPEVRHTTAGSAMLCTRHHARYDGRERPRLLIEALTKRGADGPLRFTSQKKDKS